jgi:hypothetical protein
MDTALISRPFGEAGRGLSALEGRVVIRASFSASE